MLFDILVFCLTVYTTCKVIASNVTLELNNTDQKHNEELDKEIKEYTKMVLQNINISYLSENTTGILPITTTKDTSDDLWEALLKTLDQGKNASLFKSIIKSVKGRRQFECPLRPPADLWMHCQDLITPFLTGIRKNITKIRELKINTKGREVVKILTLIKFNTSGGLDALEMNAFLNKLSQTNIRLFYWNANAIKLLVDVIAGGKNHSFRLLKRGVSKLFQKWQLDYSNTRLLLNYTSIFKPVCVTTARYGGSTSSLAAEKFIKPTTVKVQKKCDTAVCMARERKRKEKLRQRIAEEENTPL